MKQTQKRVASSLIILFISLFVSFLFVTATYAQQAHYPISQLGNCRDARECFYYCEIPHNTPACWSYGTYVLEKNVLGTTTAKSPDEIAKEHGITFPIPELGSCASAQACMQYCNAPENQQVCVDFAKKKGLIQDDNNLSSVQEEKILSDAKSLLGCDSKDSCQAFCNNPANQQKCQSFAQGEGLNQPQDSSESATSSSTILQAAKQELGCNSQDSCINYCNNPDNQQKCQSFAQAHNLTTPQSDQTQQNQQSQQPYPSGVATPPCNSQESCIKWCKDNPEICKSMQPRNNQEQQYNQTTQQAVSPYPSYQNPQSNLNQQQDNNKQQLPCSTDQECFKYCQAHPNQCPGFQQNNSGYQNNGYGTQNQQSGTPQQNYTPTPSINSQPPQNVPNNALDQQKICSQTAGCSWNGSACSCSSGR